MATFKSSATARSILAFMLLAALAGCGGGDAADDPDLKGCVVNTVGADGRDHAEWHAKCPG